MTSTMFTTTSKIKHNNIYIFTVVSWFMRFLYLMVALLLKLKDKKLDMDPCANANENY